MNLHAKREAAAGVRSRNPMVHQMCERAVLSNPQPSPEGSTFPLKRISSHPATISGKNGPGPLHVPSAWIAKSHSRPTVEPPFVSHRMETPRECANPKRGGPAQTEAQAAIPPKLGIRNRTETGWIQTYTSLAVRKHTPCRTIKQADKQTRLAFRPNTSDFFLSSPECPGISGLYYP